LSFEWNRSDYQNLTTPLLRVPLLSACSVTTLAIIARVTGATQTAETGENVMSHRALTALAAAVISSLCVYAAFAQVPERARQATEGALVAGQPPIRLEQELPGRYQLAAASSSGGLVKVVVLDTHTGSLWSKTEGLSSWTDWGSPVKQK
jgi:hypothetical protein